MNAKQAKKLRKAARLMVSEYLVEYLLTSEQLGEAFENGYTMDTLYTLVPDRMLLGQAGDPQTQGLGTRRWFYRKLKKNPDTNYNELYTKLMGEIHG
jgi:hypothetical protein